MLFAFSSWVTLTLPFFFFRQNWKPLLLAGFSSGHIGLYFLCLCQKAESGKIYSYHLVCWLKKKKKKKKIITYKHYNL